MVQPIQEPPGDNSKHQEAKKEDLTATNQSPTGNNNQCLQCMLVLVPQSGKSVPNFAVVFKK